jgi:hypothetical protein
VSGGRKTVCVPRIFNKIKKWGHTILKNWGYGKFTCYGKFTFKQTKMGIVISLRKGSMLSQRPMYIYSNSPSHNSDFLHLINHIMCVFYVTNTLKFFFVFDFDFWC